VISFDPITHTYSEYGIRLASVTEILSAVFPEAYAAMEAFGGDMTFYKARGHEVHRAMAMLATDTLGTYDDRIAGQVEAGRQWFRDYKPEVIEVETPVVHRGQRYAGTPDGRFRIQGKIHLPDWKASFSPLNQWQIPAYAMALLEMGTRVDIGYPVALLANGKYQVGKVIKDFKPGFREWANIRSVYGMMEREKLLPKKETEG
jgi:hypothetical protein